MKESWIWQYLSDFWDEFKNKRVFDALWDGHTQQAGNEYLRLAQVDASKGIFTVPVVFRYRWMPLDISKDTKTDKAALSGEGTVSVDEYDVWSLSLAYTPDLVLNEDYVRLIVHGQEAEEIVSVEHEPPDPEYDFPGATVILFTKEGFEPPSPEDLPVEYYTQYLNGYEIPSSIRFIPKITNTIAGDDISWLVDEDYILPETGIVAFKEFPGHMNEYYKIYVAEDIYADEEMIYKNFGEPIDLKSASTPFYKSQVQGAHFALWNGPAVKNIELGVSVYIGFPFTRPGMVDDVIKHKDEYDELVSTQVVINGVSTFIPPAFNLSPEIKKGAVLEDFTKLTEAANVFDYLNNPEIITEVFGHYDIDIKEKFHTFIVVIEAGPLTLQQIQEDALVDVGSLRRFVDKIKPKYTKYWFLFRTPVQVESLTVASETINEAHKNASSTVSSNFVNWLSWIKYTELNDLTITEYNQYSDNVAADQNIFENKEI